MKNITLETIYKKVTDLQRDVEMIKKGLLEEPQLREDFISRMRRYRSGKINYSC